MKVKFLAICLLLSQLIVCHPLSASVSETLKETSSLMQSKEYKKAQQLILTELRANRKDFRLWLGLGYVFEAEGNYEKALKAFYNARNLKTGLTSLSERISRLEAMLEAGKNQQHGEASEKSKAQLLLEKAKYLASRDKQEEAYLTFLEALTIDRKMLAEDQGLVKNGVEYFTQQSTKTANPENIYYLGSYLFYAGDYSVARSKLNSYLNSVKNSPNVELAKEKILEMEQLEAQLIDAKKQEAMQAKINQNQSPKPVQKNRKLEKDENVGSVKPVKPLAYQAPEFKDEYSDLSSDQLYEEALSYASSRPTKAIKLLSRSISGGNQSNETLMLLADLYSTRKGFEKEAIQSYQRIIELDPKSDSAAEAKEKIEKMNPSNEQRARQVEDYFRAKQQ